MLGWRGRVMMRRAGRAMVQRLTLRRSGTLLRNRRQPHCQWQPPPPTPSKHSGQAGTRVTC